MFDRHLVAEIEELAEDFPVIGIIGPRQVGKTTLVKSIEYIHGRETIYLDLEHPDDLARISQPTLYFQTHIDKCIVLDEVQRLPELFPILRAVIDRHRVPARFFVLGSASPELIRDSSESLAGRIAYTELTPIRLLECSATFNWQHHWLAGGFPSALLAKTDRKRTRWFRSFVQTYVERDIPLLGLKASPDVLQRFIRMLSHYQAAVWNATTFAKSLDLASPTVTRYLNFLAEAFILRKLEPYYTNNKKRLVKAPKVYVRDAGILHHMLGIVNFDQLLGHPVLGASWEGYVIEQIAGEAPELELAFYRTHAGAEIDLLLLRNGVPIAAIEIKFSSAPKVSRGFYNCLEDLGTNKNFVITPATEEYPVAENVLVCSIERFLTAHLPKISGS